jgi:GT2 family glycosyltransferase
MNTLMETHRALCSVFVDDDLFRRMLGAGRSDLGTVMRYLSAPVADRPALSMYFDAAFYVAGNPDVSASGMDPLLHFLRTGLAEQRSPHPLIDLDFIVGRDPFALGEPATAEALTELLEYDLAQPSAYFDPAFYQRQLGTAAPAHGMLRHFLGQGLDAGRQPNAWMQTAWYAAHNGDAPDAPYAALCHFIAIGDPEGRSAGPDFDGLVYWSRYQDVAQARIAPLRHFLTQGREEGRTAAMVARPAPAIPAATPAPGDPVPYDAAEARAADADLRARVVAMRQARKDRVRATAPSMLSSMEPLDDIAAMQFPAAPAPLVSILIPVFNELDFTVECLLALLEDRPATAYEVVIGDDCSTDPNVAALAGIGNLVVVRQPANAGFIANCNAAFAACRGAYVLLLNNDTQVQPGAIDRMVAALDADPALGAVGPKLIYPNGRVQEAGCYIRPDGSSGMVGLFAQADEGGTCYDRDVTYCSGAALMLRRAAIGDMLFDPIYRPAYCEDADLCLRLLAGGWRVRYLHEAVVVHHLSVSSNRQSITRKLRGITRNQQTLATRWAPLLDRLDRVRTIAFYLPQFHPTPENDLWWGPGFTEWTNVVKARPGYAGQYQPHLPADLGFYDLRQADTLRRQAALAARYGIDGFCVYSYNFGERRVLSQPLEVVRANPNIDFHWCLCWANENWTKHWDGGSREILLEQAYDQATLDSIIADAVDQAADRRYLKVDGRPLFLVYRPLLLPDAPAFARDCRAAFAAAGFPGVRLVYVESMEAVDRGLRPADLGFDASVEFPPQGRAVPSTASAEIVRPGWRGHRYDYVETALAFIGRDSVPYRRYPAVFPSWDNTARQPLAGTSFDAASPEAFGVYVEEKIDEIRNYLIGEDRLLFVNAWNEWAEGTHLEPDTGHGHRWLEALRDALAAKSWN